MLGKEQQWWKHVKTEAPPFSRDMGFPYRLKASDRDEYIDLIDSNEGKKNCYTGVYSDYLLKHDKFDKIYIDLDRTENYNTLKKLRLEMLKIVNKIEDKYDAKPRVYFSGNGFSIYIDIEPVQLYTPNAMREFVLSEFNSEVIDTHPLGDRSRISRLPFTRNVKEKTPGNRYCVPIKPDWSVHRILQKSKHPFQDDIGVRVFRNEEVGKELQKYDYKPREKDIDYEVDIKENEKELQKIMQIVKNKPTKKEAFDGRHRLIHWMCVPRLLENEYSDDEIHAFCKQLIEETGRDYSNYRDYVSYSIKRTKRGDGNGRMWRPWSWETFLVRNPDLWKYYKNALNGNEKT